MNAQAKNFEAISKAKQDHNGRCDWPPHTILMAQHEIDRMGWADGDTICGMTLKADAGRCTGTFRLLCDRDQPQDHGEEVEAVSRERMQAAFRAAATTLTPEQLQALVDLDDGHRVAVATMDRATQELAVVHEDGRAWNVQANGTSQVVVA